VALKRCLDMVAAFTQRLTARLAASQDGIEHESPKQAGPLIDVRHLQPFAIALGGARFYFAEAHQTIKR
jgi:hypothetical protein